MGLLIPLSLRGPLSSNVFDVRAVLRQDLHEAALT
jgi:hypothetical protein